MPLRSKINRKKRLSNTIQRLHYNQSTKESLLRKFGALSLSEQFALTRDLNRLLEECGYTEEMLEEMLEGENAYSCIRATLKYHRSLLKEGYSRENIVTIFSLKRASQTADAVFRTLLSCASVVPDPQFLAKLFSEQTDCIDKLESLNKCINELTDFDWNNFKPYVREILSKSQGNLKNLDQLIKYVYKETTILQQGDDSLKVIAGLIVLSPGSLDDLVRFLKYLRAKEIVNPREIVNLRYQPIPIIYICFLRHSPLFSAVDAYRSILPVVYALKWSPWMLSKYLTKIPEFQEFCHLLQACLKIENDNKDSKLWNSLLFTPELIVRIWENSKYSRELSLELLKTAANLFDSCSGKMSPRALITLLFEWGTSQGTKDYINFFANSGFTVDQIDELVFNPEIRTGDLHSILITFDKHREIAENHSPDYADLFDHLFSGNSLYEHMQYFGKYPEKLHRVMGYYTDACQKTARYYGSGLLAQVMEMPSSTLLNRFLPFILEYYNPLMRLLPHFRLTPMQIPGLLLVYQEDKQEVDKLLAYLTSNLEYIVALKAENPSFNPFGVGGVFTVDLFIRHTENLILLTIPNSTPPYTPAREPKPPALLYSCGATFYPVSKSPAESSPIPVADDSTINTWLSPVV